MNDEQVDQAVQQDTDRAAADGEQAAAMAIPEADEPLKASVLNSAAQLISPAIERLTQGEMPAPELAEVVEDQPAVPPDIGKHVLAVGAMINTFGSKMPALDPYKFDPQECMRSNAGMQECSSIIDSMSNDPAVIKAMAGPPPTGGAPEEPAAPAAPGGE